MPATWQRYENVTHTHTLRHTHTHALFAGSGLRECQRQQQQQRRRRCAALVTLNKICFFLGSFLSLKLLCLLSSSSCCCLCPCPCCWLRQRQCFKCVSNLMPPKIPLQHNPQHIALPWTNRHRHTTECAKGVDGVERAEREGEERWKKKKRRERDTTWKCVYFSARLELRKPHVEIVKSALLYFISLWACPSAASHTILPSCPNCCCSSSSSYGYNFNSISLPLYLSLLLPFAALVFVALSGLAATFAVLFVARRILYPLHTHTTHTHT